jgi:hypothetical protein
MTRICEQKLLAYTCWASMSGALTVACLQERLIQDPAAFVSLEHTLLAQVGVSIFKLSDICFFFHISAIYFLKLKNFGFCVFALNLYSNPIVLYFDVTLSLEGIQPLLLNYIHQ